MNLQASPWVALTVGIIAIGVIGTIAIIAKWRLVLRGDKANGRIEVGPAGQKERCPPLLPERYAKEVLVLVERSIDHHERLVTGERECLETQMRAFEELQITISALFKKGFSEVCAKLALDPLVARQERKNFSAIMRNHMEDMKIVFRKWFRANHYYEMDDLERKAYVDSKTEALTHLTEDMFDNDWVSTAVEREELRHIGQRYSEELRTVVAELFRRAFRASEETLRASNEEKAKYSAYVLTVSGFDPYDKIGRAIM